MRELLKKAALSLLAALLSSGAGTSPYVVVASSEAPAAVKSASNGVANTAASASKANAASMAHVC